MLNFWRNDTSFLPNLLCKSPLINYSPTIFRSSFSADPLTWNENFDVFVRAASTDFHHVYMQSFPQRAITQHSNVQVSIFETCLNFAGTGSRLYVAFVMTWYLAFTTSGRTAKAVRPVISGKDKGKDNFEQLSCIQKQKIHDEIFGEFVT